MSLMLLALSPKSEASSDDQANGPILERDQLLAPIGVALAIRSADRVAENTMCGPACDIEPIVIAVPHGKVPLPSGRGHFERVDC